MFTAPPLLLPLGHHLSQPHETGPKTHRCYTHVHSASSPPSSWPPPISASRDWTQDSPLLYSCSQLLLSSFLLATTYLSLTRLDPRLTAAILMFTAPPLLLPLGHHLSQPHETGPK